MVRAARTTLPRVFYHVVCEGGSEVFYINKLAQFLTNNGIHPEKTLRAHSPLVSRNNCTLTDPRHLLKRAMDIRRDKSIFLPSDEIYILLDADVFERGDCDKNKFIIECSDKSIFPLFQRNNFEDFLICHLGEEELTRWIDIVASYPRVMTGKEVMAEIVKIIPNYRKGSIPRDIFNTVFSITSIQRAISNLTNSRVPFSSDFVRLLRKFMN